MQISVAEYAKRINKSRYTVYRMIKEGLPKGVICREIAGHKVIDIKNEKP